MSHNSILHTFIEGRVQMPETHTGLDLVGDPDQFKTLQGCVCSIIATMALSLIC